MRISVLGLGYVGTVTATCLAAKGHGVTGVDVESTKVDLLNRGRSPVVEPGLEELLSRVVDENALRATTQAEVGMLDAEVSLVCVGTPSLANGAPDTSAIKRVSLDLGRALRSLSNYHVVVYRSTLLPGTVEKELIPILEEASGMKAGRDFGVAMNPEFLREGSSLQDFEDPSRIVIGELDSKSGDQTELIYQGIEAPVVRVPLKTAEMVKFVDNSFHALKVAFGNEIGDVCKASNIDAREVMKIFCMDDQLNISTRYFRPGAPFGGSCLPKDLRALTRYAHEGGVEAPVLSSIIPSNERHKTVGLRLIQATGKKKIGFLGLSFKPGTDDLRESPAVELAEALLGKGFQLAIYDKQVSIARLLGANRAYIEREIPHISTLLHSDIGEVVAKSEVLVITRDDPEFSAVVSSASPSHHVIDLVGLVKDNQRPLSYEGICW